MIWVGAFMGSIQWLESFLTTPETRAGQSLERLAIALSRRMNHSQHDNLVCRFVHLIDDDVWRLDQFPRLLGQTWTSDMRQPRNGKSVDSGADALDHFPGGARIILGNPRKDVLEVLRSGLAD